ncbi:MAG: hypothetical protein ACMG6E_03290 [Candidatus Roizmanbacteria bacterium]
MYTQDTFDCPCLSEQQKELIDQGFHLLDHVRQHGETFKDFSFVVFPFAKAYEGYLKELFLKTGLITKEDYFSKHFRIGKVMSPSLTERLRTSSVYKKICERSGCDLSEAIWFTWRKSRNEVFHYFPDNYKEITLKEAEERIQMILETVKKSCEELSSKS